MARKPKTNTSIGEYDYYRTKLTIGYDSKGKPIIKQFYGKSKGEAEAKKSEYIKALESGINPDLASYSLERAMYSWLWDIERYSGLKSSSFERYESIYRNYVEGSSLGRLIMADIKKLPIQKYYNELLENGKSYSVITNLNKLLKKFFSYAETEGYVVKNPVKGLKLPKENEEYIDDDLDKKIETFTVEEVNKITDYLGHTKLKYIVLFALLTGARQGEILALEKDDIQDGFARINKIIRKVKVFNDDGTSQYELKTTKPKTKTSNREIPLPEVLQNELKKLDLLLKEERLKLGMAYTENNLLFPSATGTHMDDKNLRRSWERALKAAGVEYKNFHCLRHTYATKLFENGTSILTVSRLLGHSSIKTTEIYTHVLGDIKAKEVECLNEMFN
ncbi:tyrosine-type recombinase/integrase [uncultured Tissierella sp.]|uniref:tyrosine-type recombinase/integrase n=1 Tax=uncultured Tissierella sp. TaxID=448160 RepID=UPI00280601CB|nr:tyrosine-type recombinase/integrase [uncultured Tissierella sp.]MDU5081238.1 tyrosine-type recombinase/integrase [Bacillota bacterium]